LDFDFELIQGIIIKGSKGGLFQLWEFLGEFLMGAFLPAFLISGAIKVFIRERSITRYLGPRVNPFVSYPIASIAGFLFSACSCGIIPLFASIFRHGAGIGPAMVFLTTGPAINLLAVILTWQIFSGKMVAYRTFYAILHGFIMGWLFAFVYRKEPREARVEQGVKMVDDELIADKNYDSLKDEELDDEYIEKPARTVTWLFVFLLLMMLIGQLDNFGSIAPSIKIDIWMKLGLMFLNIAMLGIFVFKNFTRDEYMCWLDRTGHFIYKILKPLLLGLFFIGFAREFVTMSLIVKYLGSNDLPSCMISSVIGAFMYFGTCVSVVIVKFLMDFGMADGPALTLFLSGPTVSFSSMLALVTIMGYRKTTLFVLIIVVLSALAGLTY
jgi:hypothetical protein